METALCLSCCFCLQTFGSVWFLKNASVMCSSHIMFVSDSNTNMCMCVYGLDDKTPLPRRSRFKSDVWGFPCWGHEGLDPRTTDWQFSPLRNHSRGKSQCHCMFHFLCWGFLPLSSENVLPRVSDCTKTNGMRTKQDLTKTYSGVINVCTSTLHW